MQSVRQPSEHQKRSHLSYKLWSHAHTVAACAKYCADLGQPSLYAHILASLSVQSSHTDRSIGCKSIQGKPWHEELLL